MHAEALNYVKGAVADHTFERVAEVGSLNINGSVRSLIRTNDYTGIDVVAGRGVDIVADGSTWTPPHPVDLAICCEVFEHTQRWPYIVSNMASWLTFGGLIVTTCATDPRPPHSAIDGLRVRPSEHYQNVDIHELRAVAESSGLTVVDITDSNGDLYMTARKD